MIQDVHLGSRIRNTVVNVTFFTFFIIFFYFCSFVFVGLSPACPTYSQHLRRRGATHATIRPEDTGGTLARSAIIPPDTGNQSLLRIRIRRIRMFLGLMDPDPDPSITKQK
jgi:hypothetical protein